MSFTATLPRKRSSAGLLICDDTGRILLVKPRYKDYWDLPGGHVEADESPLAAARREAKEELGVTVDVDRLLVVDYFPTRLTNSAAVAVTEALMFVFGAHLPDGCEDVDINLDPSELVDWAWCDEDQARKLTLEAPILWRRIEVAWDLVWGTESRYLESGYRVAGT